jgi:hypothetical protein
MDNQKIERCAYVYTGQERNQLGKRMNVPKGQVCEDEAEFHGEKGLIQSHDFVSPSPVAKEEADKWAGEKFVPPFANPQVEPTAEPTDFRKAIADGPTLITERCDMCREIFSAAPGQKYCPDCATNVATELSRLQAENEELLKEAAAAKGNANEWYRLKANACSELSASKAEVERLTKLQDNGWIAARVNSARAEKAEAENEELRNRIGVLRGDSNTARAEVERLTKEAEMLRSNCSYVNTERDFLYMVAKGHCDAQATYRNWLWEGLEYCMKAQLYLTGWSTAESAMRERALRAESRIKDLEGERDAIEAATLKGVAESCKGWAKGNRDSVPKSKTLADKLDFESRAEMCSDIAEEFERRAKLITKKGT